jgi:hypothetical protein
VGKTYAENKGVIERIAELLLVFPFAIAKEFKMRDAVILVPLVIVVELCFRVVVSTASLNCMCHHVLFLPYDEVVRGGGPI